MPDHPSGQNCVVLRRPSTGRRILIIDDDPRVADTARAILEMEGYDVVVAEGGRAGLTALQDGRFDLAIVDLFMPGMDGLETTRGLRRLAPGMPIIAMSGFMFRGECPQMPHFAAMAKEAGALATLYKPFRRQELVHLVNEVTGLG